MTREELQKVRDEALTEHKKLQRTVDTTHDAYHELLLSRSWLALAEAADHVDALLARGEDIFAGVDDGEEDEDADEDAPE